MSLFDRAVIWPVDHAVACGATGEATPEIAEKSVELPSFEAPVARVASVAETEGQRLERLLTASPVAKVATPCATAKAPPKSVLYDPAQPPVAAVASVAAWQDGVRYLATLNKGFLPYHSDGWRKLISDARDFLRDWGEDAVRAGWTTLDVFGANPFTHQRRYDRVGLVTLLCGRSVQSLGLQAAVITSGRDTTTYTKRTATQMLGAVPVWSVRIGSGA